MGDLFLKTLNMSIAASWLILAVVLLRFLLRKAPKWIIILLWGIVALRLVLPFSFESALSLIPSAETFNAHNIQYETPAIHSGIPAVNNAVNPVLGETFAPNPAGSVNPLYVWTFIVSVIWFIGIAAMLLYAVISYVRVRRSVAERVPYEGNIFLCDHVKSPFILGLVRPKIYLPSSMDTTAMEPVIAHEKAHLARRDHWWKPLGFLILAVHWFNPLCWIAYVLLCRDIELACDEKVIRQMDLEGKKQYSAALLECSTGRRLVTICPLAFGEVGVKERVKNVLNYKKPAFWIIAAAVVACGVVTVCFATNPKQDSIQEQRTVQARITEVENGSFLVAPEEGASELSSSDLFRVPITNMPPSPEPRVGGEKLILLAQINLEQIGADAPLPKTGLLQFFVGRGDNFGADWGGDTPSGFQVVWHEKMDRSLTPEQIQAMGIPTHADLDYWPVLRESAITAQRTTAWMGPSDGRFDPLFAQVWEEVTGQPPKEPDFRDFLEESDRDYVYEQLWSSGHRLLGWPYFEQFDPREEDGPYNTLLLQLDSDWTETETYIMWADGGVGNFFISSENLKRQDFSNVFYTWDCG